MMDRELDWEDVISQDSQEYILLEENDYVFEVVGLERKRYDGSTKIPPCNMAVVTLRVNDMVDIQERLHLHSKMEWKLSQFFGAIGLKKKGEDLRMQWNAVVGLHGICHVGTRKWTGNDGTERTANQVTKFYYPEDAPDLGAPAPQAPQPAQYPQGFAPQYAAPQQAQPPQQPPQYTPTQQTMEGYPQGRPNGWTRGAF